MVRFGTVHLVLVLVLVTASCTTGWAGEPETGFKKIFNGKNLDGWDGNPKFWSVEDGAITGETTKDNPAPHNTFIIWEGGKPANFELKVEFKIRNHNSGIQYRSKRASGKKWVMKGYQADIDANGNWVGTNYDEKGRGVIAKRGQKRVITPDGKKKVVGSVGESGALLKHVDTDGWNEYHIIARGRHLVQKINGHVMSEVMDRHPDGLDRKGLIGFQLHAGPPMKIQFRNVRLKELPALPKKPEKKVVFVAGPRSHGYGAHEHKAGSMLLAEALEWNLPAVSTKVYTGGWPDDSNAFKGADALVMYGDGGGGHMVNNHLDQVQTLADRGVGIVALHYAVEVPKGEPGQKFLDWIGGYFETHWSVNPFWTAEFESLPDHPVTAGVRPFTIRDEWYYHMRFREDMKNVTPILTDVPPKKSITDRWKPGSGSSGHHGNEDVYEAVVKNRKPQHVAWVRERPGGGRGFGFTGGHNHWSWGHNQFRKLVLNAIAWAAQAKLPENGVPSVAPSAAELMTNLDYENPGEVTPDSLRKKLQTWND